MVYWMYVAPRGARGVSSLYRRTARTKNKIVDPIEDDVHRTGGPYLFALALA